MKRRPYDSSDTPASPGVGRADMASKMLLFGTAAVLAFVHIQPGSLTVQCMRHLACSRSLQGRKLWNAFKVRGATRASTREHYSAEYNNNLDGAPETCVGGFSWERNCAEKCSLWQAMPSQGHPALSRCCASKARSFIHRPAGVSLGGMCEEGGIWESGASYRAGTQNLGLLATFACVDFLPRSRAAGSGALHLRFQGLVFLAAKKARRAMP